MGRSRMFSDDPPEESKNPSPRTTIVGGRPPEESPQTPPVPTGMQKLLRLAAVDPEFARELVLRRDQVAAAAGVELNARERAMLQAVPEEQLRAMIEILPPPPEARRDFLRKTAATAVVLLGGAVLSGCEDKPQQTQQAVPTTELEEEVNVSRPVRWDSHRGIRSFGKTQNESTIKASPPANTRFTQPPEGWDGGAPPEPPPPQSDGGAVPDEKQPPRPPKPSPTRGIRSTDGQE